jgi:hypothetical protein
MLERTVYAALVGFLLTQEGFEALQLLSQPLLFS